MYGWLNEHNYNRDACYRFESVVGGVSMQSEPFLIEYDFDANMHRIGDYELRRGIDFVNANDGISFIYIEQCTDTDTVCFLFT